MDYEKKYKEALEKARQLCAYPTSKPFISDLQELFPELAESEDERIGKEIVNFIYYKTDTYELREKSNSWLAWLEKQGEQKPTDIIPQDFEKYVEHLLSLSDGEGHGSPAKVKEVSAELFRLAKLEQNPAWSEEDEKQARQIERIVHNDGCSKKLQERIANWFKSLKDRVGCEVNCTTTKGWSKDDEEIILKMMFAFTTRVFPSSKECGSFVDFLKSLKHTWKPSEEQMKALEYYIEKDIIDKEGVFGRRIIELYAQLRAMKGE